MRFVTAEKIAKMMLETANETFLYAKQCSKKIRNDKEHDFEFWYGISEDWDVNIFVNDKGNMQATLYPVVDGDTKVEALIDMGEARNNECVFFESREVIL